MFTFAKLANAMRFLKSCRDCGHRARLTERRRKDGTLYWTVTDQANQ
jgi:hypothetical protein